MFLCSVVLLVFIFPAPILPQSSSPPYSILHLFWEEVAHDEEAATCHGGGLVVGNGLISKTKIILLYSPFSISSSGTCSAGSLEHDWGRRHSWCQNAYPYELCESNSIGRTRLLQRGLPTSCKRTTAPPWETGAFATCCFISRDYVLKTGVCKKSFQRLIGLHFVDPCSFLLAFFRSRSRPRKRPSPRRSLRRLPFAVALAGSMSRSLLMAWMFRRYMGYKRNLIV